MGGFISIHILKILIVKTVRLSSLTLSHNTSQLFLHLSLATWMFLRTGEILIRKKKCHLPNNLNSSQIPGFQSPLFPISSNVKGSINDSSKNPHPQHQLERTLFIIKCFYYMRISDAPEVKGLLLLKAVKISLSEGKFASSARGWLELIHCSQIKGTT